MHRVGIKIRKYITCENMPERAAVVEKFIKLKCPGTEYVPLVGGLVPGLFYVLF
jgi:hypothetical protein